MPYVYYDFSDTDDDELIEELESRGYSVRESEESEFMESLRLIYEARRLNKPYDHIIERMICERLGKVI